ncbi:MAG: hypothetical protein FWD30_03605 [Dehalococcoidia bacterium]|nr:hypothetical protein [Dehalococcoidia bacterium]
MTAKTTNGAGTDLYPMPVLKANQSQLYSFTLGPSHAWNYDLECDSDVVAYRCILRIYQIEFEGYGKMSFADKPITFIFEGHQGG